MLYLTHLSVCRILMAQLPIPPVPPPLIKLQVRPGHELSFLVDCRSSWLHRDSSRPPRRYRPSSLCLHTTVRRLRALTSLNAPGRLYAVQLGMKEPGATKTHRDFLFKLMDSVEMVCCSVLQSCIEPSRTSVHSRETRASATPPSGLYVELRGCGFH
jgi:hypothetical protein